MICAAIAGLGRWGKNLVNSTADSATLRFIAANTRTRQTAEAFCREKSLRWTSDFDDILRDPAVDAVVLATPHSQHRDQVLRAAASGKHIFVEKPFALTLADADRMLEAADKAGVVLAVGFNRRFHPSMARLREAVRTGSLGTIVTASAEQTALHGLDMTEDAWRARPEEAPGGAMTAIGVHLVDGMIDLLGPVASVFAQVARRAAKVADDTTDLLLTFESGAKGHIFCSTVATPNYRMAVFGTAGFAEILGHPMATFRQIAALPGDAHTPAVPEVFETKGFNLLTAELEAFAAAIDGKRPFPTPLSDIRHGVAVFEAILRSAASGRPEAVA
ncbi:MAG: Gfo/Idh/MocA family oxidoreductase [Acetobacteraceae bacterium]|nr:Gfo/Idh/MocA family oxidoreductase [Acetobacteraceae bacterium]